MENTEDIWNDFEIFSGRSTLTPEKLFKPRGDGQPRQDVKWFYGWLDSLREDLENNINVGIYENCTKDVLALLNAFFPKAATNSPRIRTQIRTVNANTDPTGPLYIYGLDPIDVTYNGELIHITDGPGALCYIFNVAIPPKTIPETSVAVRQWIIPLQVALSRCLYLAYCFKSIRQGGDITGINVTGVPIMSCVMWFIESETQLPHYILGSTYVTANDDKVININNRKSMQAWRRGGLIDPQLKYFNPERHLPPMDSPYFISPTLQEQLEEFLLMALRGQPLITVNGSITTLNMLLNNKGLKVLDEESNPWLTVQGEGLGVDPIEAMNKAISTADTLLQTSYEAPFKAAGQPAPEIRAIDRDQILNNTKATLGADLRKALSGVLRLVWSYRGVKPTDKESKAALTTAFSQVFSLYFAPHYYLVIPGSPEKEVEYATEVPIVVRTTVEAGLFAALWPHSEDATIEMAFRIYHWVMAEEDSLVKAGGARSRWGRCAETHPVCGLMPDTTKERRLLNVENPSSVQGMAMEIRAFNNEKKGDTGNIANLADQFTWGTLAEFNENRKFGVFKLPCANCQLLLPALDVPTGKDKYDAELYFRYPDFKEKGSGD